MTIEREAQTEGSLRPATSPWHPRSLIVQSAPAAGGSVCGTRVQRCISGRLGRLVEDLDASYAGSKPANMDVENMVL